MKIDWWGEISAIFIWAVTIYFAVTWSLDNNMALGTIIVLLMFGVLMTYVILEE